MNVRNYLVRNRIVKMRERLKHPWPFWKKAGGLEAVVIRADGSKEALGEIATQYVRRRGWTMTAGPK